MKATRLGRLFQTVKKTYFPRWDKRNRWTVTIGDDCTCRGSSGYCDSKVRTIYVKLEVLRMPDDGLQAFIIHEICHDVGAGPHNVVWAKRMEVAARKAVSLRLNAVADILRSDIYSYCGQPIFQCVTGSQFSDIVSRSPASAVPPLQAQTNAVR